MLQPAMPPPMTTTRACVLKRLALRRPASCVPPAAGCRNGPGWYEPLCGSGRLEGGAVPDVQVVGSARRDGSPDVLDFGDDVVRAHAEDQALELATFVLEVQ